MMGLENFLVKSRRYPLLLKDVLFPTLSNAEIATQLYSIAENDYSVLYFCPFIKSDFRELLSIDEHHDITLEQKEALSGLAFEMICVCDNNPDMALLVWLLYCCRHSPADWVHDTNVEAVLNGIHSYCTICTNSKVLTITHEAIGCFSNYYREDNFLRAVAIYIFLSELLQITPNYKEILINQYQFNRDEVVSICKYEDVHRDLFDLYLDDTSFFRRPIVHEIDIKDKFYSFFNSLLLYVKEMEMKNDK